MKEDKERLKEVISYSKLSRNAFAKKIGYSNGTVIYQILDGRNGISAKLTKKICDAFPQVNFNWLLSGKGNMLKGEMLIETKPEAKEKDELMARLEFLERHIKGQDARIELLERNQRTILASSNSVQEMA